MSLRVCYKSDMGFMVLPPERVLRVTGRGFVAGAIFQREGNGWKLVEAAPILRWMWRAEDIKAGLVRRGCGWEWL